MIHYEALYEILMVYCYQYTRELKPSRIQRCIQFKKMEMAIKAGSLENAIWIVQ